MRAAHPASGEARVVEISSDPRVPIVRMLVRVPDPEGDHYAIWEGYVMVPLAHNGWTITIRVKIAVSYCQERPWVGTKIYRLRA